MIRTTQADLVKRLGTINTELAQLNADYHLYIEYRHGQPAIHTTDGGHELHPPERIGEVYRWLGAFYQGMMHVKHLVHV